MKLILRNFTFVLITCFLFLAPPCQSNTKGYPKPINDYVNDYARVLKPLHKSELQTMLKNLEFQTGIEAVVVTINSINDYQTQDINIESFATNLFNSWGIGHKDTNDGILILVSIQDRECRIELGSGYGTRYNSMMKRIIDVKMIPYFQKGDFSLGIYEGTVSVIDNVTRKVSWFEFYMTEIILSVVAIILLFAGISCLRSGKKGWGYFLLSGAVMLIVWIIKDIIFGKYRKGFGGGDSSGGGASGKW